MVDCGPGLLLRRPFSIHQVDSSGCFYILFVIVHKGTYQLSQYKKGQKINILGPLGNGFFVSPDSEKLLLVGGGIGISPLAFLAHNALNTKKQVTLLAGARDKNRLYLQGCPQSDIKTIATTEDGSTGTRGMVTDILSEYINEADQVFACGPVSMYRTIADLTGSMQKTPEVQVSLETRMGCGIGTCYGCSIKTAKGMKQVCKNGPIFNLDEIDLSEVRL